MQICKFNKKEKTISYFYFVLQFGPSTVTGSIMKPSLLPLAPSDYHVTVASPLIEKEMVQLKVKVYFIVPTENFVLCV